MAARAARHRDRDVGRSFARHRARGGEDIQALRESGTRLATGIGSIACLVAVAVLPFTRGDDQFQGADLRVAAVAVVVLVAAVVHGWAWLVPASITLVGGAYAAELAIDDATLDLAAPLVAVGLVLAAELAYWSLDERVRTTGDPGEGLRRAALVALGAAATLVLGAALLAFVDEIRARGLALDLIGVLAAVAVVVTVVVTARDQPSNGS